MSKENEEEKDAAFNQDIYTKIVKAGNRTYFFDVKLTRKQEHYLTITESKKRMVSEGQFQFEKHKIFLYSEDFDKFMDALYDCFNFINDEENTTDNKIEAELPDDSELSDDQELPENNSDDKLSDYTNIEFEDLNN